MTGERGQPQTVNQKIVWWESILQSEMSTLIVDLDIPKITLHNYCLFLITAEML